MSRHVGMIVSMISRRIFRTISARSPAFASIPHRIHPFPPRAVISV